MTAARIVLEITVVLCIAFSIVWIIRAYVELSRDVESNTLSESMMVSGLATVLCFLVIFGVIGFVIIDKAVR